MSAFLDAIAPFLPYIRIELCQGENGRKRIELDRHIPLDVAIKALDVTAPCVACENTIHPFRKRAGSVLRSSVKRYLYLADTCDQETSKKCSKGRRASDGYIEVVAAVRGLATE